MIRLMRFGRRHQPFFRLVVVPKRSKPTRGKFVDAIGWVDPLQHKRSLNAERAKHWLKQGARPSDTVWNLFVSEGIVAGKKRPVHTHAVPEKEAPAVQAQESVPENALEAPAESLEAAAGEAIDKE